MVGGFQIFSYVFIYYCFRSSRERRNPDGQRSRLPDRDAPDPDRQVRRDVRQGLQGRHDHAVSQGQVRHQDRPIPQRPSRANKSHDQLDRRLLRLLDQGIVDQRHEVVRERHLENGRRYRLRASTQKHGQGSAGKQPGASRSPDARSGTNVP